jgi:hypothetical protein
MTRRPADDNGGIGLLLVMGSFIVLAAGLVLIATVTDLGIAAARARTAADAAALAAMSTTGEDACTAARAAAEANGALLRRCDTDRHHLVDATAYPAVEVEVDVHPANALTRSLAGPVPARAAAALHPNDPIDA